MKEARVFEVDEAWDFARGAPGASSFVDVRDEAKALRFITSRSAIDGFRAKYGPELRPYTLSGSGDFHHLSAVWISQFVEPFTLISFDNHPDWDIRPPQWSCGAWINRALENPLVQQVQVWGCGSFECLFPWRILGNRWACRDGRLEVYPWRQAKKHYPDWLRPIEPETWWETFTKRVAELVGKRVYLTLDLDVLRSEDAATNWEPGRMRREDLLRVVALLKERAVVIGGDICGGYSAGADGSGGAYATTFQRLAAGFDHPKQELFSAEQLRERNNWIVQELWPLLCRE